MTKRLQYCAIFLVGFDVLLMAILAIVKGSIESFGVLVSVFSGYVALLSYIFAKSKDNWVRSILRKIWNTLFVKTITLIPSLILLLLLAVLMIGLILLEPLADIKGRVIDETGRAKEKVVLTITYAGKKIKEVDVIDGKIEDKIRYLMPNAELMIDVEESAEHQSSPTQFRFADRGEIKYRLVHKPNYLIEIKKEGEINSRHYENVYLKGVNKESEFRGFYDKSANGIRLYLPDVYYGDFFQICFSVICATGMKHGKTSPEKIKNMTYTLDLDLWESKVCGPVEVRDVSKFVVEEISTATFQRLISYRSRLNDPSIYRSKYLLYGMKHAGEVLERPGYVFSYNKLLRIPDWAAYKIQGESMLYRRPDFTYDPQISKAYQANREDYVGPEFDRGNIVGLADMRFVSESATKAAAQMTVIAPQTPQFNRKTWLKLENYAREYASEGIYIIAGTLFLLENAEKSSMLYIGENQVAVPTHFFRILALDRPRSPKVLCFIIPNSNTLSENLSEYLTSVDMVEEITGLDFFTDLDDEIEGTIESEIPTTLWEQG